MRFAALALLALAACSDSAPGSAMSGPGAPGEFVLHTRSRKDGKLAEEAVRWDGKKTVVILCDMWDDHTCKGAARRVGEMVPKFNAFLRAARAKGALVVHAPSD